ncbi:hypothetical protein [Flavobacterium sp. Root186]|uniref:hypothetical protein n=1 Tax=Flavobacterium sp. Root186 TaxID=1736485 RepID=UPI0006FE32C4|nr:hypothetical protein [Flavobacterium sp. Root186]KRB53693.1 hypothetical protein ASD98_22160 [Flavobacterium sp. Root186]
MKVEICTVDISKHGLDDQYTFYDDESVIHIYDRNNYRLDIKEEITIEDISDIRKERILEACKPEYLLQIKALFDKSK